MLLLCGTVPGMAVVDNAVNGLPTCANPAMNQTLRGDWGFEGYVLPSPLNKSAHLYNRYFIWTGIYNTIRYYSTHGLTELLHGAGT